MIVRCPECSTGFKLPRDQVSDEGVKLRCSKCSHVFRFRIDDDGETEIFYNDSDRERNAQLEKDKGEADKPEDDTPDDNEWEEPQRTQIGTPGRAVSKDASEEDEEQAAEVDGNKTAFGMPTAKEKAKEKAKAKAKKKAKKRSKSASSDYNPFPHANLDITAKKGSSPSTSSSEDDGEQDAEPSQDAAEAGNELDWDDGDATRVDQGDPFGDAFDDEATDEADEEADAFGGAFDDEDGEDPEPGTTTAKAPGSGPATTGPATTGPPASAKPAQPATATKPPQQATKQPAKQAPPTDAAAPVAAAEAAAATAAAAAEAGEPAQDKPADGKSSPWQTDNAYRPEDMVDPSFGEDGPSFDPDQGVVAPNKPAADQPAANQPAANQPAANQPQNSPAAAAQTNRQQPASSGAAQPASAKAEANWDVDPVDDSLGSIEPHTVGGSGLQKTANFALIALIVAVGFFGLLAALSGWVLDFKRFPHMLEVAFEGAEFEPRDEWTGGAAPEVAVAPENPVRFNSVFATRVALNDSDEVVFLVRGKAENVGQIDFSDVVVRGILYDKNERVVAQTKAPLGGRLLQSEIAAAASADEAVGLLPTDAAALSEGSTQPFSLVFDDVPKKVLDNPDLLYNVEIAESNPPADQPPEAATGD